MSSLRYLPNTLADFPETEGHKLQLPLDYLKNSASRMLDTIKDRLQPNAKNASDGLYLGTAGVSYMYYHLSKTPAFAADQQNLLKLSHEYLKPSLMVAERDATRTRDIPSFILGNCGIYAVAAVVFNALGDKEESLRYFELYKKAANTCKDPQFLSCGSDELFVGRAGYLFGALWLAKELKMEISKKDVYDICEVMVNSGRSYARRQKSPCPLMYAYYNVEYFGAAHGLCSILQALLSVPGYLADHPEHAKDVKASVDYLLSLQDKEGNFPCDSQEIGRRYELVHWCHGAPGMIYLMAKAYLVWREEKYIKSCLLMGELVWETGLLKKGPGICHGVAGNGYVFLLLFRLTKNPKFLHRAIAFAQFLDNDAFRRKARTPDHPYSLYEGIAGTVCFVGDILAPDQSAFPFMDVFS